MQLLKPLALLRFHQRTLLQIARVMQLLKRLALLRFQRRTLLQNVRVMQQRQRLAVMQTATSSDVLGGRLMLLRTVRIGVRACCCVGRRWQTCC